MIIMIIAQTTKKQTSNVQFLAFAVRGVYVATNVRRHDV